MSPPIRDGSGNDIGAIRLGDGSEISEVRTGAGDVLFNAAPAIPDSGDLKARYDFTESNGSAPVVDQTGNGFALSGSFSGVGASINGVQAGDFDGIDDSVSTSFATVSQPTTIFIAFELRATNNQRFFDGGSNASHLVRTESDGPFFNMFAGRDLDGNSPNTNPHIFSAFFNGANSILRIDGTQQNTGDAGSDGLDGVTLGSTASGGDNADIKIGEVLVYPQDKSGIFSDVESYLSGKWGITI